MDRIIRIDDESLKESLKLTPQDRLRQANAAFRLYHSLHHPYEKASISSGETLIVHDSKGGEGYLSS